MSRENFHQSERLRIVREKLGSITQAELARRLGIPVHRVKDTEAGKVRITVEFASLLEEKLHVGFRWALTGEGDVFTHGGKEVKGETFSETEELLSLARKILSSGDSLASRALSRSILYFAHAAEIERRVEEADKCVEEMSAKLKAIEEELERIKGGIFS